MSRIVYNQKKLCMNTQNNNTQHEYTHHNETQYKETSHNDTQHNDNQHKEILHNDTHLKHSLSVKMYYWVLQFKL
jgi:hypothetical protein